MTKLTQAVADLLKLVGDRQFSLDGDEEGISVFFPDGRVFFDKDGEPKRAEGSAVALLAQLSGAAAADEEGDFVPKFTADDLAMLYPLVDLKHTFTLDCSRAGEELPEDIWDSSDDPNHIGMGWELDICGHMIYYPAHEEGISYEERSAVEEKWLQNRIRTFKQDDGEIGVELTYTPMLAPRFDSIEHVKKLYHATQLSTVITEEDFLEDVKNEAEWVDQIFGGSEIYELYFAVRKPRKKYEFDPMKENFLLLEKPLWIQHEGNKYQVWILLHQD